MLRHILALFILLAGANGSMATDWNGWRVEGMVGHAFGSHDLTAQSHGYQTKLYSFDVDGNVYGLAVGYRHQLWQSNWYLGAEAAVKAGEVTGGQRVIAPGVGVAEVRFTSETFATLSLELGYQLSHDWLLYAQGGLAGAEMNVSAVANNTLRTVSFQDRASGWVLGEFAALGVTKRFESNWYIGTEVQWYQFDGTADISGHPGQLRASNDHTAVLVVVGYQF